MTAAIRTDDHLTIMFDDGVSATVYNSNPRFQDIVNALKRKQYNVVRKLALPAEQVKSNLRDTFGITEEQVTIQHGIVFFQGSEMDNTLTRRMIQMLEEGFDISPLKAFLCNLQNNPSYRAVNELYGFLEKGNLPITEDGHFLAYKKVRADYRDCHSGKFDNSVGQVVSMARNEVDEDSRNECSNGLHFCSRNYLSNFGGEHIMIVKINPADVVAIPADYNSSKGRTCRYEVIGELEQEGKLEGSFRDTGTRPTVDDEWLSEDEDLDDEDVDVFHIADDEDEDEGLDVLESGFVGIPADDSVTIPRAVALEIASELDNEDVWSIASVHPVLGTEIERYATVTEASEDTGANASSIRKVLKGQRLTAGGLIWKRVSNDPTAPDQDALDEHKSHGSLFHGAPHHTGGKHNAKKNHG